MGRRMSHSYKRSKSKFEQFRMAVPADLQDRVGQKNWTQSLGTTDPVLAAERRGQLIASHKEKIRELRAEQEHNAIGEAIALLDRTFERLADRRGSMDASIAQQLNLLASFVCDSWVDADDVDRRQTWGDMIVLEPRVKVEAVPSIDTEPEREIFRLRAQLIEERGIADGLVHQELARLLLKRRIFRPIWFVVSHLSSLEPRLKLERDEVYDAVAEAYLRRLAEHEFTSWPSSIHEALIPAVHIKRVSPTQVEPGSLLAQQPVDAGAGGESLLSKSLTEAHHYWIENRKPGPSAVTEASRSINRFVALFGDTLVKEITRQQVIEFRNLISDIPPQTELSKVNASGRTLRQVIDVAREKRRAWEEGDRRTPEPGRLAPASVKKDVGALSQIIGKIAADVGSGINVAAKVEIAGYSKKRKGQKVPRLPYTPAMMQALFDSPLYTGCAGYSDAARTQPGTHLYQDEMYWSFLFGVVAGPRLGEIGQIALTDVHYCDLRRTFGDEYEGSCTYLHITGSGENQRVKTAESDRYVVIHDRLIDVGFDEYVERRRKAGKIRLFDLEPDEDGNFTKELSRRLNRYLDRIVTTDPRYVFHSTRHEFTDRANLSEMPTRVANSIKGHANSTVGDDYGLVSILNQSVHLTKLKVGFIDWGRLIAAIQFKTSDPKITQRINARNKT